MKARTLLFALLTLALTMGRPETARVGTTLAIVPDAGQGMSAAEHVRATLASRPAMFIQNAGQLDERALFQVRGGDKTIWLAEDGIWVTVVEHPHPLPPAPLSLSQHWERERGVAARPGGEGEGRAVALKLSFPGANPHPHIEPFNRLETAVNYLIGNDAEKWHTDVPVWTGVRYVDLYPGIDLVVGAGTRSAPGQPQGSPLPWHLEVRDGADVSAVRLRVEGADEARVEDDHLRLQTAVGEFALPLLAVDGWSGQRAGVLPVGTQTFDVASPFTSASPLPGTFAPPYPTADSAQGQSDLLYATFLGGSGLDWGSDIAVDEGGNVYVTGWTESSDFPATPGAYDTTYNGGTYDAFVAKLDSSGGSLLYATFLGGLGDDWGNAVAVDGSGNAYVVGWTSSSDLPVTPGAYDTTYNGGGDAFVARMSSSGSDLLYATFLGGWDYDEGVGIAVDEGGNAYVTGHTHSSNFPATPGAYDTTYNYNRDAFVAKLRVEGGAGPLYTVFLLLVLRNR